MNYPTRRSVFARAAIAAGCTFGGGIGATSNASAQSAHAALSNDSRQEWQEFKRRFVTPEGRVIDTANGGATHTEGLGLGMLFAVAFDDPAIFDLLLSWTARHMRRPGDALHAWRYQPNLATPITDWNNATDGDLFIGAALLRAARRWGRPDHAQSAGAIARDVLRLLVRDAGPRTVLLPGSSGFEFPDSLTINPSYYVFPILAEFAEAAPSPIWDKVRDDGIALVQEGRFGQWQLPPDWLRVSRVDGALSPHPNWPARFSYDAIRVPLYLAWARVAPDDVSTAFCSWAAAYRVQPAWVDLTTNINATYPAPPGMVAIARIAAALQRGDNKADVPGGFPPVRTSPDYYSAALILLSRLAWQESRVA